MIKKEKDSDKPLLSNRDKKTRPNKVKFWCGSCDAALVGSGSRCPSCRKKDPHRRMKK